MIRFPIMDPFSLYPEEEWTLSTYPRNEMDMYEEDDNLVIELKAPSFDKEDLSVSFDSGVVTITGKTKEEQEEKKESRRYFKREIERKSFTRRVDLPVAVNVEEAKATFKDGVLRLTMPKLVETKQESSEIEIE
jgi:HSP20 family protein